MLKPERRPTHPGKILQAHYLEPRKITLTTLAQAVGRTRKNISEVVNGHSRIDVTLANRLAAVLGTTARFWLNMQNAVDLWDERQQGWEPEIVFEAAG
jgi:addiction module HigA family antidote